MDRIRKREFTGSFWLLWLMFMSGIGIPAAIVYLIESTIETEYEVNDAEAFWESYKTQRSRLSRWLANRTAPANRSGEPQAGDQANGSS